VLLAYDVLDRSVAALEETARLQAERTVMLTVVPAAQTVHAAEQGVAVGSSVWEGSSPEAVLADAQAYLREHGVEAEVKVAYGDALATITREHAEEGYDLLVVGTRFGEWLDQALLGNVSERLAEVAPCPVLVAGENWLAFTAVVVFSVTGLRLSSAIRRAGDPQPVRHGRLRRVAPHAIVLRRTVSVPSPYQSVTCACDRVG
jgi:nucleotide-binding universal stress UspA family protein